MNNDLSNLFKMNLIVSIIEGLIFIFLLPAIIDNLSLPTINKSSILSPVRSLLSIADVS